MASTARSYMKKLNVFWVAGLSLVVSACAMESSSNLSEAEEEALLNRSQKDCEEGQCEKNRVRAFLGDRNTNAMIITGSIGSSRLDFMPRPFFASIKVCGHEGRFFNGYPSVTVSDGSFLYPLTWDESLSAPDHSCEVFKNTAGFVFNGSATMYYLNVSAPQLCKALGASDIGCSPVYWKDIPLNPVPTLARLDFVGQPALGAHIELAWDSYLPATNAQVLLSNATATLVKPVDPTAASSTEIFIGTKSISLPANYPSLGLTGKLLLQETAQNLSIFTHDALYTIHLYRSGLPAYETYDGVELLNVAVTSADSKTVRVTP